MTVAEIKEYIRKRIVDLGLDTDIYEKSAYRIKQINITKSNDEKIDELENVYLMLDQLDEWVDVRDRLPNEDEMYYNGVRDYNDDTFRTSSDKVLAQDENGEIYCGYFMSSCWHHEYNGEGRIENEYTRYGEACWEFGVDDGKELIASIGTNIKIIAWKPLPKPYERKE